MEDYIKILEFTQTSDSPKDKYEDFKLFLLNIEGIQKVTKKGNTLFVEFNSYIHVKKALIEIMKENGYESDISVQNKKGFFAKWVDKLAKTNKEKFGSDRLECCDLND